MSSNNKIIPGGEEDHVRIECRTVLKQQTSRRKAFDWPVALEFDLPIDDQL